MDDTDNRRDELCDKFRQSLSKPVHERFFDEDELVEIFDYAGDMNDEYLRFETLLCGARLYPESESLRERRAIFYSTFSDDLAEAYLGDNTDAGSLLFDILRLRQTRPSGEDAENALQGLLNDITAFTDEEIIQYVDLASSLNACDWLFNHLDEIRHKVDYLPSFLYEVAIVAEMVSRYDISTAMLEELTEIDPYNTAYWTMLANDHLQSDNIDGARSAIEYALAIEPENDDAIRLNARILYDDSDRREEAFQIIKRLASRKQADFQDVHLCAMMSIDLGHSDEGLQLLIEAFKENPASYEILNDILLIGSPKAAELLDRFYANGGNDESLWTGLAQHYYNSGKTDTAITICEAFERNFGKNFPNRQIYLCCLFQAGNFEKCLDVLAQSDENDQLFSQSGQYWNCVIYLISLLKTHRSETARMFGEHLLSKWNMDAVPLPQRLEAMAMRDIVIEVLEKFIRSIRPQWKRYDPLNLWGKKD